MNYRSVLTVVVIVIAAGFMQSDVRFREFYQFILHDKAGMASEDCMLIERYYRKNEERLIFRGIIDPYAVCLVTPTAAVLAANTREKRTLSLHNWISRVLGVIRYLKIYPIVSFVPILHMVVFQA